MTKKQRKKRVVDYITQRDEELWAAFKKAWDEGCDSFEEAVRKAVHTPCSRLWMSEDFCYRLVKARLDGKVTPRDTTPRPARKELYDYIYMMYKMFRKQEYLGHKPMRHVCSVIVNQPASQFYLSEEYAVKLIRKLMKQRGKNYRIPTLDEVHASVKRYLDAKGIYCPEKREDMLI